MQATSTYFLSGLASGWTPCPTCGTPQPLHIVAPETLAAIQESAEEGTYQAGLFVITACRACGRHHADSDVSTVLWTHPVVQRFLAVYPRAIAEPATFGAYQSQLAIRVRWIAIVSAAQLTLFAHPQTLQVLASFRS
jgi:hypothetical protein